MKNSIKLISCFSLVMLLSFTMSHAQNNVFNNGGGDGLWNNVANWSLGHVPIASDAISISGGATVTISSGVDAVGKIIYLGGGGGNLIIEANASLTMDGPSTQGIRMQPGNVTNHGTLNIGVSGNAYGVGIGLTNLGPNSLTNTGTINLNNTNTALGIGNDGWNNYVDNTGEINIGPTAVDGIHGGASNIFNNDAGGSVNILGASGDGISGTMTFNNDAGATLCTENIDGDPIEAVVTFNNNGTYNTSGCTPPLIPTMGEWSLILFGLIVLSFATIYVMRWQKTLKLSTESTSIS